MTAAILSVLALASQSPPEETLVIRGGRVLTMAGASFEPGVVIVRGGKIVQVGKDLASPPGARTVDATGKVVMPGLVDAGPAAGSSSTANEEGSEVTPLVRALDAVDAAHPLLSRARQSGVTTVFVGPGNRNVIGGLGAVIKTAARDRAGRVLREDAALKAALGSGPSFENFPPRSSLATFFARRPTTRMGVEWEFRKAFQDARRAGEEGGSPDEASALLLRAMAGKLPVRIAASRATDLETALRLSSEFGLSLVVEEGHEAWKRVSEIAGARIPVLLRPTLGPGRAAPEGSDIRLDTFTLLRAAGVRTALLGAGDEDPGALLLSAAFAVRHGARPEEALEAVTRVPAEILGVADRVGTLEAGKDADVVIFSGDPLDVRTRVERVLVDGREVAKPR